MFNNLEHCSMPEPDAQLNAALPPTILVLQFKTDRCKVTAANLWTLSYRLSFTGYSFIGLVPQAW